jgi:hypothetical protein
VCANLTAKADQEVECEEDFSVQLTLSTSGSNLNLLNTAMAITIIDANGIICQLGA